MEEVGEHDIEITIDGKCTDVKLYCAPPLDDIADKRVHFIANKQQEAGGSLDGAYLIYDNETDSRYYSHLNDHNGGRERVAMGALIALWLQKHDDPIVKASLHKYVDYIYRELFDDKTGDVFNDIHRSNDWDRLYNYPWMSTFFMEFFKSEGQDKYLLDSCKALRRYYEKDGIHFYGIGIQAAELTDLLEMNGYESEAKELRRLFLLHADYIKSVGLDFPKSEVNYEQSITAPAVSISLQAYQLTKNRDYLKTAEIFMDVLKLFNGHQPDYHLFENAIRHWDGYWFGKNRCFGDTFPHYWSVLTGTEYLRYARLAENITEDFPYEKRGRASLRGCLNLFFCDGSASCAMVYPASVNGKKAHYYDPWANDQDWALYYALKYGI